MEEAGNNFLLPLLKGLCRNMLLSGIVDSESQQQFQSLLKSRFPNSFSSFDDHPPPPSKPTASSAPLQVEQVLTTMPDYMDQDYDEDDDEDAPVVVSAEEVEASLARSSAAATSGTSPTLSSEIQRAYPLLTAAILPHEDVLMTCARILDEKRDVSLVREAAAYLEEVEQHRL